MGNKLRQDAYEGFVPHLETCRSTESPWEERVLLKAIDIVDLTRDQGFTSRLTGKVEAEDGRAKP